MGNKMEYNIFTYGTLRVDEPNSKVLEFNSKFQETCISIDKYIMVTQTSKSFPFIFPLEFWPEMADKAVNIVGDLYNVNELGIKRCDKLEGHPTWYERTKIKVKNITGRLFEVEAYLLTKESFEQLNKDDIVILNGDWKHMD
uniref:Gamma-glutamylcyclotransferase AIG2-like domain-containing protein n=1 Tax=viral metagenome TaxID=1070528 RepID=A0A6C0DWC5_9ZZZZ